jgi:hypothetical protein
MINVAVLRYPAEATRGSPGYNTENSPHEQDAAKPSKEVVQPSEETTKPVRPRSPNINHVSTDFLNRLRGGADSLLNPLVASLL